jgi:hypothetical protein
MTRRNGKAIGLIVCAAALLVGTAAEAQQTRYDNRGRPYYGAAGPNSSYQAGPRTRVYVTKRSWLDAGTEVLPGERKFNDYAFPPVRSFARENLNRPLDRQPLSPPYDLGYSDSYTGRFPLY